MSAWCTAVVNMIKQMMGIIIKRIKTKQNKNQTSNNNNKKQYYATVSIYLEYCWQFWFFYFKCVVIELEKVGKRPAKILGGMKCL